MRTRTRARVHAQSSQLMAKYGVNVPYGVPAFSVEDVRKAAEDLKDEKGEVGSLACRHVRARAQ